MEKLTGLSPRVFTCNFLLLNLYHSMIEYGIEILSLDVTNEAQIQAVVEVSMPKSWPINRREELILIYLSRTAGDCKGRTNW